jgi:hypothetical protein
VARSTIRSATGLRVNVEVEGLERTDRAFKDVRNRAARNLREIQQHAAEEEVLPRAKRKASGLKVAGQSAPGRFVITKGLRNSVVLTTSLRGVRARAVGLIEFGGTVHTPILPKKKKALAFGGRFAAKVTTVRHYRARLYMTKARDEGLRAFGENVRDRLVGEFAAEGFEVR